MPDACNTCQVWNPPGDGSPCGRCGTTAPIHPLFALHAAQRDYGQRRGRARKN